MVNEEIVFPILELTDWIFDSEKVLEPEHVWNGRFYIKIKDPDKHLERSYVDPNGNILKLKIGKVIRDETSFLSFIIPPKMLLEIDLEISGYTMTLDEVKKKVISRSFENFDITHNKKMTEQEYNFKLRSAKSFEELFMIASFGVSN